MSRWILFFSWRYLIPRNTSRQIRALGWARGGGWRWKNICFSVNVSCTIVIKSFTDPGPQYSITIYNHEERWKKTKKKRKAIEPRAYLSSGRQSHIHMQWCNHCGLSGPCVRSLEWCQLNRLAEYMWERSWEEDLSACSIFISLIANTLPDLMFLPFQTEP